MTTPQAPITTTIAPSELASTTGTINGASSTTTLVASTAVGTTMEPFAEVVSKFGFDYQIDSGNSTILKTLENMLTPAMCHHACEEEETCEAWQLTYFRFFANKTFPSCQLYSTAVFDPNPVHSDLMTISGSMNDTPFMRSLSNACDRSSCSMASQTLPTFLGAHAKYIYKSSCTHEDEACLPYPGKPQTSAPECCVLCGTPGTAPCDLSPWEDNYVEGSEYHRIKMETEEYWRDAWEGPGRLLSSEVPSHHGWGCWTTDYKVIGSVNKTSLVNDVSECADQCALDEQCHGWRWVSSVKAMKLQKCELLSEITSVLTLNASSDDQNMVVASGLPECLPSIENSPIDFLTTLEETYPVDITNAPVVPSFIHEMYRNHGHEDGHLVRIDLSSMIDAFTFLDSHIVDQSIDIVSDLLDKGIALFKKPESTNQPTDEAGGTDEAEWYGFRYSGLRRLDAEEDARKFSISRNFLVEALNSWVGSATAETIDALSERGSTSMQGVQAKGLTVECSHGLLSQDCIVECTDNEEGTSVGVIKVGLAFTYDVHEMMVTGPAKFEIAVVDGVCPELMTRTTTTSPAPMTGTGTGTGTGTATTEAPQTTTIPVSEGCTRYGFLHDKDGVDPIESVAETAEACASRCTANDDCTHYNHYGTVCVLLQSEDVLDTYYVQNPTDCETDCTNDAECHDHRIEEEQCHLFDGDVPANNPVSRGMGMMVAMGPSRCDSNGEASEESIVPRMDLPGPDLERLLDGGINPMTVDDFEATVTGTNVCSDGFMMLGGKCLKIFPKRLSLQDASRTCSDLHSTLFAPDQTIYDALCSSGLVDCAGSRRSSEFWTRYTLTGSYELLDMHWKIEPSTLGGLVLGDQVADELDECVVANLATGELAPSTCGVYCLAPPTALSTLANAPECGMEDGRLALKRRPFVCEQLTSESPGPNPATIRKVSYIDDDGNQHCAMMGSDIVEGDLWNTGAWAEPIVDWYACEGLCRDLADCNGFTFLPPHCNKVKEEADKGWDPAVVVSESTRVVAIDMPSNITGQAECDARCAMDSECNNSTEYIPGVCYIKSRNTPRRNMIQWIPSISGPVPCDTTDENAVPNSTACPSGYQFVEDDGDAICVAIDSQRMTAPEAHRSCQMTGGILASPKTENQQNALINAFCPDGNLAECLVPRGNGALDGVFYFGLGSTTAGLNDTWHWIDGTALEFPQKFGGQPGNAPLVYNHWPTTQPDNTSGNQLCSYYYPRDSPSGALNGGWGDEDCDTKCLVPASSNQIMSHAPTCAGGEGRITHTMRRYICSAVPSL